MKKQKTGKLNTNKGITLIALVITIIVMLILVAVTIAMAINGGLFGYAGKATGETQNAIEAEQQLGSGKVQIDGVWYDSIDDYLAGKPSTGTGEGGNPEGGLQIELSIAGEKVTTVPVPTGFRHKEGTIDEGYVIINETDGNEFVWVPVDKNQKITLKITSDKDIKFVGLMDPNLETIEMQDDKDVEKEYYNTNITPTINGLYTAYVATEDETVKQYLMVKSLYTRDAFADWYISDECTSYPSIPRKTGVTYSNKEEFGAAVAESLFGFESLDEAYQQGFGIDELISMFVTTYYGGELSKNMEGIEAYAENVNKNGGFYIGRYEAGISTWDTSVGLVDENPVSKEGYYSVSPSFDEAIKYTEKLYSDSDFTVGLPTDAAWDRTLRWFYETGAKGLKEIAGDSKDWGNYLDAEFEITRGRYSEVEDTSYDEFIEVTDKYKKEKDTSVLLTTGATERNCVNNIYDLAGNFIEWTNTQINLSGVSFGRLRGGVNSDTGSNGPALYFGRDQKGISYLNYGFRYALYLN